jgi:hypothetical protein
LPRTPAILRQAQGDRKNMVELCSAAVRAELVEAQTGLSVRRLLFLALKRVNVTELR